MLQAFGSLELPLSLLKPALAFVDCTQLIVNGPVPWSLSLSGLSRIQRPVELSFAQVSLTQALIGVVDWRARIDQGLVVLDCLIRAALGVDNPREKIFGVGVSRVQA